MSEQTQQRPGKGCFFYGCLTFLVILISGAVGTYFGTRKAVRYAVDTYLHKQPVQLPKVALDENAKRQVQEMFRSSLTAASTGKPTPPLELTADQFNVVMSGMGWLGKAESQIYFLIETNQLKSELSLVLDQFQIWRNLGGKLMLGDLNGRYLNGTALLDLAVTNGVLDLKVTDVIVNGKSLPGNFTGSLKTQNIGEQANQNPEAQNVLKHIERVEIRDDKVYIHFMQPAAEIKA